MHATYANNPTVNYTYDKAGRRTYFGGNGNQYYQYDADGNQTRAEKDGKEVTLYFYDEASRLQQVTNPLGFTVGAVDAAFVCLCRK